MEKKEQKAKTSDLVRVLILPLFITKAAIFYFGLNYSKYPDQGYGYGLAISIFLLFLNMGRFLWKYKDQQDPW
jgi:hypothetical protein